MGLRTKILLPFAVLLVLTVAAVTWKVSANMREAFSRLDELHTAAMAAQLQREFELRGESLAQQVAGIASAESTLRLAVDVSRSGADLSLYVNEARDLAAAHQLDFLELVGDNGDIISSAQWPARFGYQEAWLLQRADWDTQSAFARLEELPNGRALAIEAVRSVRLADRKLYIVGGRRLDVESSRSLSKLAGMEIFLYHPSGGNASPAEVEKISARPSTIDSAVLLQKLNELATSIPPGRPPATTDSAGNSAHIFGAVLALQPGQQTHVVAFTGPDEAVVAALAMLSSREELQRLEGQVRNVALGLAGAAVIVALLISGWTAARVTRPVEQLAVAADQVAAGNMGAQVDDSAQDEIGRLAYAFNRMTRELLEQRERLLQTERVAAWRELARRLAHELKNPLFPLQITVENLLRARQQTPQEFDEVFRESAKTLLAEIGNLKEIISRFSDFSKMPVPELQPTNINDVVRRAVKFYEPQFHSDGCQPITPRLQLESGLEDLKVSADPELLHRAFSNLVLNALDAMPQGGTLTLRTARSNGNVRVEVSDTGLGLTSEERRRLFTPYYTSKQYGTGLGLAIVQSVISDHHGKIWVESEKGKGTTFIVELPQ